MFAKWGWYVLTVIIAVGAVFYMEKADAQEMRTHIAIRSTPGPAPLPQPPRHHGGHHHGGHHHHHAQYGYGYAQPYAPPAYYQPAPVYVQPAAPRYYQTCQSWDAWRQQYIYVPC